MAWLSLAGLTLAAVTATATSSQPPETSAERLHRKGVHCMEVIERPECAIENFEALLDQRTRQRELLTDGMLRLLRLYRQTDREDEIGPLLRRFWDAGGDRRSRGHVPYSARFLPDDLDILVNADPPRLLASELLERGGDPLRDTLFTCDPVRRHDIEVRKRWERAAAQARVEGRETWEVFYEKLDEQAERRREYEERRKRRGRSAEDEVPPLVFVVACPLVEALELTDNRSWRRVTSGSHHRDQERSVAIFGLDDLEARMASATEQGRLLAVGPGRWRLPELDHPTPNIELAVLDRGELVAAPRAMLDAMVEARDKRKRRMNRELARLVGKVPRDTGMFVVLTPKALRQIGVGGMERKGLRKVLEAVLPRPKGLQIAAIAGSSLAFLTRVPTDTAVRGRMLVNVANMILARNARDDPEAAQMLADLDVAEAADRKALLASYVITPARLETMLWDTP